MWSTIAAGVLRTALSAYDSYRRDATDLNFPKESLKELLSAVDVARLLIRNQAREKRLDYLTRTVMRVVAQFYSYDRYSLTAQPEQWTAQGEHLRKIITDSALLIKDLQAELDRLNLYAADELDYAVLVFALYAVFIPVYTTALVERSTVYATSESARTAQVFASACGYVEMLLRALRRNSDAQFSTDYATQRGEPTGQEKQTTFYGFTFQGNFVLVGTVQPDEDPKPVIRQARSRLQQRKEVAFAAYPGAAPVIQFYEYLGNL